MAPGPPPQATRSQPSTAAGLGSVALGTLVAVAVAALFLVLIGASRGDRLTPPEHYRAVANPGQTRYPAIPRPWPATPGFAFPQGTTRQPGSRPALEGFALTTTSPTERKR